MQNSQLTRYQSLKHKVEINQLSNKGIVGYLIIMIFMIINWDFNVTHEHKLLRVISLLYFLLFCGHMGFPNQRDKRNHMEKLVSVSFYIDHFYWISLCATCPKMNGMTFQCLVPPSLSLYLSHFLSLSHLKLGSERRIASNCVLHKLIINSF